MLSLPGPARDNARFALKNGSQIIPRHVAIIMDGNGRWAKARGLDRSEGHAEGARAVRDAVETATRIGVECLTLYAFSVANWARPRPEVEALMRLLVDFAKRERSELRTNGIRVNVIGQLEDLPTVTRRAVLVLPEEIDESFFHREMTTRSLPDVDLLIRTGGETRVSDFLLFESAYAELVFLPIMWPDFMPQTLLDAIELYSNRERRFGRTSEQVHVTPEGSSAFDPLDPVA
jgi:undecaprenyl diphosphate synthase